MDIALQIICSVASSCPTPSEAHRTCTSCYMLDKPGLNLRGTLLRTPKCGLCISKLHEWSFFFVFFLCDISFVFVYVDDVLITNQGECGHIIQLQIIFQGLSRQTHADKWILGTDRLNVIRHRQTWFLPIKDKIERITDFTQPTSVWQRRCFVRIINYYRNFIPYCS